MGRVGLPATELVTVYRSPRRRDCTERALVLDAMGIDHEVVETPDDFMIVVAARDAGVAVRQIELYEQENRRAAAPETPEELPSLKASWPGVAGYAAVEVAVMMADETGAFGMDWHGAGAAATERIRDGELWRCVTALTLHADYEHLLANLFFGAFFGVFVGQILGSGLAWLCILFAGATGNALNALVQPAEHVSIGASTAVFGALGLLTTYAFKRRRRDGESRFRRFGPVIGGVALLALTGAGGERVDVLAHVTGFAAGAVMGAFFGGLPGSLVLPRRAQWRLGAVALSLIALAWAMALSLHG